MFGKIDSLLERGLAMKAKDIIKNMQELNPEEEVMIAYWYKRDVAGWFEDGEVTDEVWKDSVNEFDSWDLQDIADEITTIVDVRVARNKK
jgi:hypothetical protein